MENTLEAFLLFCDECSEAEEGLKEIKESIGKAWDKIHGAFNKVRTFITSLRHNINYFKNATLPQKMSEDLQFLLQNLTPRREYINKLFPLLMNSATKHLVQNKHLSNDPMKDFNGQVNMSIHDVVTTVNDAIHSEPYKRLYGRQYDFTKMSKIPLNTVISKMKELEMDTTSYENMIRKVDKMIKNPKDEREKNISIKLKKLYNALIVNLQLRCKLLLVYFKAAKASIKGTINNVKSGNTQLNVSRDYKANKNKIKQHTRFIKKPLSEEEMKKFKELDGKISGLNNDYTKYNEYIALVNELCSLIGIHFSKDKVILYDSPSKNQGCIKYSIVNDKGRRQKILDNTKLYHTSTDPNLTVLSPRYYFHSGDLLRRLWPTPRVYFAIGTPISNDGNVSADKTIYTPKNVINEVCIDEEMGGTAVYVTCNNPIAIQKVDIKKIQNIELPKLD